MTSSSLRENQGTEVADQNEARRGDRASSVRITVIVQNRYTFDTHQVTGRQIRDIASVPAGFGLYRRAQGGNEAIADDAELELRHGDHFFARPSSSAP
jgi:hypothetical protein